MIEAMKMYMPIPVSNIVTFVITAGGIVVVNGIMGRIVGYVRDDNTVYDPTKAMELLKATRIEIKDERTEEERRADDMEKAAVALAYSTEETATMPGATSVAAAAPIAAMPIAAVPQTRAAAGGAGDYHVPANSSITVMDTQLLNF